VALGIGRIAEYCENLQIKASSSSKTVKNIENLESFLHRMPRESKVGQICQYTMLTSLKIILSHDFVFQPPMIDSKH